jgi:hypothetical protein
MKITFGVKLVIGAAAIASASIALPRSDVHAESALEFMLNGGAANFGSGPGRYVRRVEPVRPDYRADRYRAYPPEFYEQHRYEDYEAPRSQNFERVVCERVCDGRRFVMAIQLDDTDHAPQREMCRAAGGDAQTRFWTEAFVPGGDNITLASMQTGRSTFAGETCPADVAGSALTVPILNDSTLERGDIVATTEGFKVFRGRGPAPHEPSDFVALDPERLKSNDLKSLQVAVVP